MKKKYYFLSVLKTTLFYILLEYKDEEGIERKKYFL